MLKIFKTSMFETKILVTFLTSKCDKFHCLYSCNRICCRKAILCLARVHFIFPCSLQIAEIDIDIFKDE
jgi:hypothetical protein